MSDSFLSPCFLRLRLPCNKLQQMSVCLKLVNGSPGCQPAAVGICVSISRPGLLEAADDCMQQWCILWSFCQLLSSLYKKMLATELH